VTIRVRTVEEKVTQQGADVKTIRWVLAFAVGLYFIGRAVAEPFIIDMSNPDTYRLDWGGPSLPGVLLVHCGPGVISLALMVAAIRRRRPSRAVTPPAAGDAR
jgi:hypothetical protein